MWVFVLGLNMDLKGVFGTKWFAVFVNVIWLVCAALVLFVLMKVDAIVNGELYNYGLQYNVGWWINYSLFFNIILIFIGIPMVLSAVTLVFSLWAREEVVVKRVTPKPKKVVKKVAVSEDKNHMLISCPHCHKLFGKPLIMLDFTSGKSKLVSVCPYCNKKLTDTENGRSGVSTGILGSEEEVVEE